jgi:hypothetical protein
MIIFYKEKLQRLCDLKSGGTKHKIRLSHRFSSSIPRDNKKLQDNNKLQDLVPQLQLSYMATTFLDILSQLIQNINSPFIYCR